MTQTREEAAAKAAALASRIAEVEKAERLVAQYTPEEAEEIWLAANPVRVAATELHRAVAIVESRFEIEPEPEVRQRFEATAREVRAIHRMTPELTDRARSVIEKLHAFQPKDAPREDDRKQGRQAEAIDVVEAVSVDDAPVPDAGGPDRGDGDIPGGDPDADALRAELEEARAEIAALKAGAEQPEASSEPLPDALARIVPENLALREQKAWAARRYVELWGIVFNKTPHEASEAERVEFAQLEAYRGWFE